MNIYIEKDGTVHLDDTDQNKDCLFAQGAVTVWKEGVNALKDGGGIFDVVEAYSPKVEEFLNSVKQK